MSRALRGPLTLALALLAAAGCTALGSDQDALARGDEAFARGDVPEALAEYRLAIRQGAGDAHVLLRTAHTFALTGRLDEAREHYVEALERDPDLTNQAVASLVQVARDANARGDAIRAATALEVALQLQPGVSVSDLALPLAQHFSRTGQYGDALPFYQKALAANGQEPDPEVIFQLATTYEELGDCERAILYFEEIREEMDVTRQARVDWHMGSCSFQLARDARMEDDREDAISYLDTLIDLGEPRNLLAQAYFEKGELLAELAECTRAVQAFQSVQRPDLTASPVLVERAQDWVDQIRFGQGCPPPGVELDGPEPEGSELEGPGETGPGGEGTPGG